MLNEEETDQTGRESLQEPITANGSQLSAQSDAPSHRAFCSTGGGGQKKRDEGETGRVGDGVRAPVIGEKRTEGNGERRKRGYEGMIDSRSGRERERGRKKVQPFHFISL